MPNRRMFACQRLLMHKRLIRGYDCILSKIGKTEYNKWLGSSVQLNNGKTKRNAHGFHHWEITSDQDPLEFPRSCADASTQFAWVKIDQFSRNSETRKICSKLSCGFTVWWPHIYLNERTRFPRIWLTSVAMLANGSFSSIIALPQFGSLA